MVGLLGQGGGHQRAGQTARHGIPDLLHLLGLGAGELVVPGNPRAAASSWGCSILNPIRVASAVSRPKRSVQVTVGSGSVTGRACPVP